MTILHLDPAYSEGQLMGMVSSRESNFARGVEPVHQLKTTMKYAWILFSVVVLLLPLLATAQLSVTVSAPKVVGRKAVVPLVLENGFSEKVESARAVVFLLDEEGKCVAQATKWVIGGSEDKSGLAAKATNTFYFVIANERSFGITNLTATVTFSRLVLAGGKLADPDRDVNVTTTVK